jgi:Domain of unknown function (DUF4276)
MKKVVIYVEGNTELVFVREYLKIMFDNQTLEIECRKRRSNRLDNAPYDTKNTNALFHFRIIDVGGDDKVLDEILADEKLMTSAGYERIIGLRDMFSESYKKVVKQPLRIDVNANQKFIARAESRIKENAKNPEKIKFHFAIMEIEAWLLAIPNIWIKKGVSQEQLKKVFKADYQTIDPETIKAILKTINENYGKHASEVESLVSHINKQDFEALEQSSRCHSFKTFTHSVSL